MDKLKQYAGFLWMAMAILGLYFLGSAAYGQIKAHPVADTYIQWGVFVVIFIPICLGLFLFGWFAVNREYDDQQDLVTIE